MLFVWIHPFIDGNGRTSRLLLILELIKDGFPPAIIKVKNRLAYYEALDKAHTQKEYNGFYTNSSDGSGGFIRFVFKCVK